MDRLAHVKWFVDQAHTRTYANPLSSQEWIAVVALLIIGIAVVWAIHGYFTIRGVDRVIDNTLSKYARYVPYVVRYTVGALFIINAAKNLLFAPNVPTSVTSIGTVLSTVLALTGVLLILGIQIRIAAAVILFVYGVALSVVSPVIDVLDHVEYIGIGLYLILYNDTKYAALPLVMRYPAYLHPGSLLRIFVGLDLMILALSEKLVGIANSAHFLQTYNWNFMATMGVSDRHFIVLAGVVELLVGLTLILNIAPRIITAVVVVLMTITAVLLGIEEVYGHLFALSLVAVVWLYPMRTTSNA